MTLFSLLLVLGWERLFKLGDRWQLDRCLVPLFARIKRVSLAKTLLLLLLWMLLIGALLQGIKGLFFGLPTLLMWVFIGLLCFGAGAIRRDYRAYMKAARRGEQDAMTQMTAELALIPGLSADTRPEVRLRELQSVLVWINYRFYLAPLFYFVIAGPYGPVALGGYALLRAYQTWLTRQADPLMRAQAGIDRLLHWVDWIPVRLAGIAYALLGHGERALPAWLASLGDLRSGQYQVLTGLAQLSLARDPHLDGVKTPLAAVTLARRITLVLIVAVALLTIYGALL
ncbi:beta-lactamase regulator AmpE [Edwardsiella anguillarum]|uniref:beta-lactamase regulator AmpE n=1 Tax=Edwardsiella TaxID=635 RepID=UPI00045D4306|nr:beta-lactamase regulator AmpE [Edwardsiella anguillarum]AKM48774.1 regulatory protein AmpE [Edwardsiella sp. EA181011]GAJ66842.1 protein AmpE [Edwardsiella piscicida]RFT04942.1 regulatory signaling modulator protein AmpE [Edwardsiella anguillarum]WHP80908.1 beta-lactamase regulator AmpE [Edwardsiella anguillarum]WHQ18410.1 beta-lactamase regulator AmpE [Edwardsiella anguillarum]